MSFPPDIRPSFTGVGADQKEVEKPMELLARALGPLIPIVERYENNFPGLIEDESSRSLLRYLTARDQEKGSKELRALLELLGKLAQNPNDFSVAYSIFKAKQDLNTWTVKIGRSILSVRNGQGIGEAHNQLDFYLSGSKEGYRGLDYALSISTVQVRTKGKGKIGMKFQSGVRFIFAPGKRTRSHLFLVPESPNKQAITSRRREEDLSGESLFKVVAILFLLGGFIVRGQKIITPSKF